MMRLKIESTVIPLEKVDWMILVDETLTLKSSGTIYRYQPPDKYKVLQAFLALKGNKLDDERNRIDDF